MAWLSGGKTPRVGDRPSEWIGPSPRRHECTNQTNHATNFEILSFRPINTTTYGHSPNFCLTRPRQANTFHRVDQEDQYTQSTRPSPASPLVMDLHLDLGSDIPLYRQIADQMAERIERGELAAGTRLPPTRLLAEQLSTHRNTVVRAFEELTAAGLIDGRVGRGSFVRGRPGAVRSPVTRYQNEAPNDLGQVSQAGQAAQSSSAASAAMMGMPWSALLSRSVQSEPLRRMARLSPATVGTDTINLSRMQASADLLPHEDFRSCIDTVLRRLGPDALGYAPGQGLERLRTLIAGELARDGMQVDADDLLITTGSQQALDLIARSLVDAGDVFLTEGRTYSGALNVLTASGAEVIGIPTDEEGPDPSALRQLATGRVKGLYLMPNSRNPTGSTISEARRKELVSWSQEVRVPLVEDDYGADLILDPGPPLTHLRALDTNVFHVGTYSKKLIPALRVGYIVCPAAMRAPLVRLKHAMDLGTSTLLQHALAEFLERGLLPGHIERVCTAYRERRDTLVTTLSSVLPRECTFRVPDRGVVLWLSLPPGLDPEVVYEEARLAGVLVSPGSVYSTMTPAPSGLRLTYCAEPVERIAEGAKRLGRALTQALGRRGERRRLELFGA